MNRGGRGNGRAPFVKRENKPAEEKAEQDRRNS